jgi:hypothetical protein
MRPRGQLKIENVERIKKQMKLRATLGPFDKLRVTIVKGKIGNKAT